MDTVNKATFELQTLKDNRAIAVVGALLVEHELDQLLAAMIPGYQDVCGHQDFTFAMKISLARAMNLCPSRIFNDADELRKIRNKFSHDLSVKSFAQIESRERQSIRDRLSNYQAQQKKAADDSQCFIELVRCVVTAMRVYAQHVLLLNQFMRDESFLKQLEEFVAGKNQYHGRTGPS